MPPTGPSIDVRAVARRAARRALAGAVEAPRDPATTSVGSGDSGSEVRPTVGRLRVAVGCDHAGFALKQDVLAWLRELGHVVVDLGTRDANPCDWPDYGVAVGEAVGSGQCDVGVVLDGLGIGTALAASKVPGVRAANCLDAAMARSAREHDHANVLALGAGRLSRLEAHEVLRAFLATPWGGGRYARRVEKLATLERRFAKPPARRGP